MMKKYISKTLLITGILIGLFVADANAQWQFTITRCEDSAAVVELIKTVFLDGVPASQYNNVTFTGDPHAVGYFTNGYFLGFERPQGIVMGSGFIDNFDQANSCTGTQSTDTGGGSDPDLQIAAGQGIQDACIIEFNFKPAGDSVKFNYVFSSEEYHEWVNTEWNDVFGFFLSGPGIDGTYSNDAINIAEVPGTHSPVTIFNVNCGNAAPGCDPTLGNGNNCQYLVDNLNTSNSAFNKFNLDAYTVPFVADNGVESCQWYHIKLAIGDASDNAYDSGVFLEKGSFDPGKVSEETEFSHPTVDSLLYEGCNNHEAVLYFSIGSLRNDPYILPFTIGGTATRNEDYTLQSTHSGDSIYIDSGRLYDSLIIRTFVDGDVEGIEDIKIYYNPVMCGFGQKDSTIVLLSDLPPMVDTAIHYSLYCQDTVTLGFSSVAGGVPPYTFDWYTLNKHTSTVNFIPNGNNQFNIPCVVYDTCGQQVSDTAIVVVPGLLTDAGPDQSMCNQPTAQLSGLSPGAQTFFWTAVPNDPSLSGQENIPNPVVAPTVTTSYTLLATDNCTNADDDITQVLLEGAVANAGTDQQICIGDMTELSCNVGSTGETYTWSAVPPDPSLTGQENNQVINVSPLVTTTYSVTLINECNYTASDNVKVNVTPLPIVSAGSNDNICFGQSFQLQASGGTHFQWSSIPNDPSLFVNGQDTLSNPVVTPPTQAPYTYTVEAWDECSNTAFMVLSVDPVPSISVSTTNDVLCFGSQTTLTAVGTADEYTWSSHPDDPSLIGQENNASITVSPQTTTLYTLVGVVSGFSCPATISQQITVKPELFATFDMQGTSVCQNSNFTLLYSGNAGATATFNWDFDGATITSGSGQGPYDLTWSADGAKTVSLTVEEDGCSSQPVSQNVNVLPTPVVLFAGNLLEGCEPLTVEFTNSSTNESTQVDYLWQFGSGSNTSNQESPSFTYTIPGTYTVSLSVTNDGQCESTKTETAYIQVFDTPEADFSANPEAALLEEATIQFENNSSSIDNLTYSWNFGDGASSTDLNPSHTFTEEGTFAVTLLASTANGCENEITNEVTIYPNFAVYAPSAFTPNSDGLNDVFQVKGIGIQNYSIKIFTRWGQMIFESNNIEDSWDGKMNGNLVEATSYVYLINYQTMLGKDLESKGTVTVMY